MPSNYNTTSPSQRTIPQAFAEAAILVESLIETRKLRKEILAEAPITTALRIFGQTIEGGEATDRLRTVSILGKASEVSKPVAALVRPILTAGLQVPLPRVGTWGSADDRYYLAKGVSLSTSPWTMNYAATELAQAEVAERSSRAIWAEIAVSRASTLAEVIGNVSEAFSEQMRAISDPVDTAYRKLVRICEALSAPLATADVTSGEGFGRSFVNLVIQAGGQKGGTVARLREDAAVTVLELMVHLARLRFEVLLDADFYRAAGIVRGWWRPGTPPSSIEAKCDRIAQLAVTGLHILARQGVTDDHFRQALSSSLGAQRVNETGRAVAATDPSLDPSISRWMATGQALSEKKANESVREDNERLTDEILAKLLIAVDNQDTGPQALDSVADNIEIIEPLNATTLRQGASRMRLIEQWSKALGERRYIATSGERGKLVRFDPALHQANEQIARLESVRITAPAVIKQLPGRPAEIVVKAIVEKIGG
ncbi:hypothetical protein ABIB06_004068 [Bradyrhizobium sp. LB8.2]|uniref:hypothetical protein n=1 Tax=Bradyrhizobium sp. LB8.2 TaxID=3156330 RepID=UPI00339B1E14